jgi:hypothetical protein
MSEPRSADWSARPVSADEAIEPSSRMAMGSAVAALRQTTAIIPIVFAVATDPLGDSLVVSLARPGSNVTELSQEASGCYSCCSGCGPF